MRDRIYKVTPPARSRIAPQAFGLVPTGMPTAKCRKVSQWSEYVLFHSFFQTDEMQKGARMKIHSVDHESGSATLENVHDDARKSSFWCRFLAFAGGVPPPVGMVGTSPVSSCNCLVLVLVLALVHGIRTPAMEGGTVISRLCMHPF